MYYVYIIRSLKDQSHYIGQTKDVPLRLKRHNAGHMPATKSKVPWELVRTEAFLTRVEAMKRERQLKAYKGGNAFKKLLSLI